MHSNWPHTRSPFHAGEQQVQQRLGVRDKIEAFARRVVRDHMTDQHRDFFEMLPFVMLGTVDDHGRPWASLVAGSPGFMTTPDARTLDIAAPPVSGDPLSATLKPGADIGVLGIQLETRRRNRLTGRIGAVRPGGFTISIGQAFGNCPQYIQTRTVEMHANKTEDREKPPVIRGDRFDGPTRALIENADTLFIATAYRSDESNASQGADVSHRGGKPGFVRVEDERTFVFPDFSGNNHFNTVGNILLNPKAGFLFADFESGDIAYLTGKAEIIWEGEEVHAFAGAERLIRFRAEEVILVEAGLPLRFRFGDYSPMLALTGSWEQSAEIIAANKERSVYLPYELFDIKRESSAISSFYLRRADGRALAAFKPGQFLPIKVSVPGHDAPLMRTYTLSEASGAPHYRLSIKRGGADAQVSNFLHDHAALGVKLEAMAPRGKFVLDQSSDRPIVLLSAGVGITPMIAMTNFIINEGRRTRNFRRTYFIHGARNGSAHAFGRHIHELASSNDALTAHFCYSAPGQDDQLGKTHDSEGHVDIELLKRLLPFDDYDFYLCGPHGFMQSLYDGLVALGVRLERIHYESFGPATVLKRGAKPSSPPAKGETGDGPVAVHFANADVEATWTPDKGTLLDLAEAAGLAPAFSCRSGICGTCATRIKCGTVDYLEEPTAAHAEDEVLICCATPRTKAGAATCGEDRGVVLDL